MALHGSLRTTDSGVVVDVESEIDEVTPYHGRGFKKVALQPLPYTLRLVVTNGIGGNFLQTADSGHPDTNLVSEIFSTSELGQGRDGEKALGNREVMPDSKPA
jgi:hypothetical protein